MSEALDQKLATLKLGRIRQIYPSWIEQASRRVSRLCGILGAIAEPRELLARQENVLRRKMKAAGFPYPATIEQFEFALRPELKRPVILRYFDSSFVTSAGSLLLIGPSGLGKTHLSIALGTKTVQLGFSVRFVVAQQLANALLAASSRAEMAKTIAPLIACDLLILDEFGYLAVEPQVGPVLYEIIAGRYGKGATV